MNSNIKRNSIQATLFAAALLATCLFAVSANAQSAFQGKFTLQHETRWGDAVLPAGDYVIELDLTSAMGSGPSMAVIRNAASGKRVAFVSSAIVDGGASGGSALLIASRGKHRVVHSFRVTELGEVFIYDPALARGRIVEEARSTEAVPVLQAKK